MSYFVRVNDAGTVRRRLLESSKDLLHMLKGYHELLDIREKKKEVTEELRTIMSELAREAEKLQKVLPEQSLKEVEKYLPKKAKKSKKSTKTSKKSSKGSKSTGKKSAKRKKTVKKEEKPSELDRLQNALANIEDRLSKL